MYETVTKKNNIFEIKEEEKGVHFNQVIILNALKVIFTCASPNYGDCISSIILLGSTKMI